MVMMIELEVTEKQRPLPPPNFTVPFSFPTLRWARRRRLRCSSSAPSRSPDRDQPTSPSPYEWQKPPMRPGTTREEEMKVEDTKGNVVVPVDEVGEEKKREEKKGEEKKGENGNGEGRFLRSRAAAAAGEVKGWGRMKKKKVELWVSLSREEIEEDFYSFTGMKLPRRPKKRPRTVPANLVNRIFPGSWLPNVINPDMYKVHEPIETIKR